MIAGLNGGIPAFLLGIAGILIGIAVVVLYRAVRGPTIQDRVIAVNVAGTNTVVVLVLVALALGFPDVLDIAIVYALLNFVLSIAVARLTTENVV